MLRALIVDDEPAGRERLRDLLVQSREVEVIAECESAKGAAAVIRSSAPDVVFLDIEMPEADGFFLIRDVGERAIPAIVFVTAHEGYARRAFDVEAVDFLLKPFDATRLQIALSRVRTVVATQHGEKASDATRRLPLRSTGHVSFVIPADIEWIDIAGGYARIHDGGGGVVLTREPLPAFERLLDPARFVRVSRTTIVNAEHVLDLERTPTGRYVVRLSSGLCLVVGRDFRRRLESVLGVHR